MTYEKGMQFTCPHCSEESVVKLKTEMDGWTKVGEFLACTLCDTKLENADEVEIVDTPQAPKSANKLMDFLGTDEVETEVVIEDDSNRRFCRDCSHLLDHPFKMYCLLHKKDINPMDDCDKFARKK